MFTQISSCRRMERYAAYSPEKSAGNVYKSSVAPNCPILLQQPSAAEPSCVAFQFLTEKNYLG
jgi:hypothetical protein